MPLRLLLTLFSTLIFSVCHVGGQEIPAVKIRRVVIDPGHGGRDPGSVSQNGRILEKSIVLSVSLKLGELIKLHYPEIEVIYTRSTDLFVPLDQRSEIANRNKADLFISIHVNAALSTSASGSETFVMGMNRSNSNMETIRRENSVILLEGEDYAAKYEGFNPNDPESYIIFSLLQNAHIEQSLIMAKLIQEQLKTGPIKVDRGIKQDALLVLWKTTMPSVLVELGFISNTSDLNVMSNSTNQSKFASLIYSAFEAYKRQYESGIEADINMDAIYASNTHYRIQILSSSRQIPANSAELKGLGNVRYIRSGTLYKYTVGEYRTIEEARSAQTDIRRTFPQAFIIKVTGGEIVPLNP